MKKTDVETELDLEKFNNTNEKLKEMMPTDDESAIRLLGKFATRSTLNPRLIKSILTKYGGLDKFCRLSSYDCMRKLDGFDLNSAIKLQCLCRIVQFVCFKMLITILNNLKTFRDINNFLTEFYRHFDHEVLLLFIFDKNNNRKHFEVLNHGNSTSVSVNIDRIYDLLGAHRGRKVLISHNHPEGRQFPSVEDIKMTENLYIFCCKNNIEFLDHVIVSNEGSFSFTKSHLLASLENRVFNKIMENKRVQT